ncbi:hypothetical protein MPSEU_000869100 [Mayamaea pseudoterrestris]|nr:hypothetical protein MPSEU_000869100 [Mayamaea pseudoterrestris]
MPTIESLTHPEGVENHPLFLVAMEHLSSDSLNSGPLELVVDEHLVDGYLELDDETANQALSALEKTPIEQVGMYDLPRRMSANPRTRAEKLRSAKCQRFCKSLGSISTLKKAILSSPGTRWNTMHAYALQSMQQITSVKISCRWQHSSLHDIATSLRGHGSIQEIHLRVPDLYYPSILPILRTSPLLGVVKLQAGADTIGINFVVQEMPGATVPAAQAIADLLESKLRLVVCNLAFDGDAQTALCAGITRANVSALEICSCSFQDPLAFADALANSPLTELEIKSVLNNEKNVRTFLNAYATSLSSLSPLKKLSIDLMDHKVIGSTAAVDKAMVNAARKLAHCSLLSSLSLSVGLCSPGLDEALACCLGNCAALEELTLVCRGRKAAGTPSSRYSLLLKAMETNYTLKHVALKPLRKSVRGKIETFCRLNKAGRKYMATDSGNQIKAIRVLAQVSDDLTCLFTHLRENPLACKVNIAQACGKRKAMERGNEESRQTTRSKA